MNYPVICTKELAALFGKFCWFNGDDVQFKLNGDFEAMLNFIGHI